MKTEWIIAAGIFFITGAGLVGFETYSQSLVHRHSDSGTGSATHQHRNGNHSEETIDVSDLRPSVEIQYKIRDRDVAISLDTTNFRFLPNRKIAANEKRSTTVMGHAHIQVDNHKPSMIYAPYISLHNLEPGSHSVRVILNNHAHKNLTVHGTPVMDHVTFRISGSP